MAFSTRCCSMGTVSQIMKMSGKWHSIIGGACFLLSRVYLIGQGQEIKFAVSTHVGDAVGMHQLSSTLGSVKESLFFPSNSSDKNRFFVSGMLIRKSEFWQRWDFPNGYFASYPVSIASHSSYCTLRWTVVHWLGNFTIGLTVWCLAWKVPAFFHFCTSAIAGWWGIFIYCIAQKLFGKLPRYWIGFLAVLAKQGYTILYLIKI